jgi:hypothetical protein
VTRGVTPDGRGLLLGGGDGIGTTASQQVRARLFCGSGATATVHESGLVPLSPNGDVRIDDVLAPVAPTTAATPAAPCTSPVLLIVSSGGNWFAAGILK